MSPGIALAPRSTMKSITGKQLAKVGGGYGARWALRTWGSHWNEQQHASDHHATPTVPIPGTKSTPTPNMGAPKYSAAWWDQVRARGLAK
jgi:hypothetical protein